MTKTTPTGGVGASLRALRTLAGMTLDEVSEAAGVSVSYLSRAETNTVTPTPGWVELVASKIGDRLAANAEDAA